MDFKKISLPYKFEIPLGLSNLSSQSWPRNYKKKTKEINSREKNQRGKNRKKSLPKNPRQLLLLKKTRFTQGSKREP